MTLLSKTFHSLFGSPDPDDRRTRQPFHHLDAGGLRLLTNGHRKPTNVVDSATVKPAAPGVWGLHQTLDHVTESIGSESCDIGSGVEMGAPSPRDILHRSRWCRTVHRFPPPLPWLSGTDGRRGRFIRAVRTDGRVVLTEVTIKRPDILRASREGGRLRLQLVGTTEDENEVEEEEETVVAPGTEVEARERWEVLAAPLRCQVAVSGAQWWNHRFVTTA